MKVIKPSASLEFITPNALRVIETAARTCYKSEGKTDLTDDTKCKAFVKSLLDKKHESTIEHCSASFRIITNRGVLAELTRHRLASFSVESTRYCNYSSDKFGNELTFIWPSWILENYPDASLEYDENNHFLFKSELETYDEHMDEIFMWLNTMKYLEDQYNKFTKGGMSPQDARGILPNDLKTELVITANFREWRTILKQRLASNAHPDIKLVMQDVLKQLKEKCEIVFDDLE